MATSRTGTTRYKRARARVLHRAQQAGLTNCPRCKVPLDYQHGRRPNSAETDHIIPHARGGTDDETNLTVICRHCNQSIGDKRPRQHARTTLAVENITFTAGS